MSYTIEEFIQACKDFPLDESKWQPLSKLDKERFLKVLSEMGVVLRTMRIYQKDLEMGEGATKVGVHNHDILLMRITNPKQ
jgi:hypothetical protein